ncbi:hypothetical protein BDW22DRAFT_1353461 [Trametopsis cervina]|nr:hypothetical protein BDW22DRAFT_1353461 [Trametopsis cervina]
MSENNSDFAEVLRISSLTPAHRLRKIRVAGRLQAYALEESIIVLEDDDLHLLVDISLCLSGQASYPWLRERNTVVVAVGYLEVTDMILEDDTEPVTTIILHALLITERRELDLRVWNAAIEQSEKRQTSQA